MRQTFSNNFINTKEDFDIKINTNYDLAILNVATSVL